MYIPKYFDTLNGRVKAIGNVSEGVGYIMHIKYADNNLMKAEAHTYYWKVHYARLVELKEKYDLAGFLKGRNLCRAGRTELD